MPIKLGLSGNKKFVTKIHQNEVHYTDLWLHMTWVNSKFRYHQV